MGLFDKTSCSLCGVKTNMLTNRKLADGNMCKDCAKQLSPFVEDRKGKTVAEISDHLAYREANKAEVASFNPTRDFGGTTLLVFGDKARVYIDDEKRAFILTRSKKWREENPDVIKFSQVKDCTYTVEERSVITQGASNKVGEREYDTFLIIEVDSPYFEVAKLKMNDLPASSILDLDQVERLRFTHNLKNVLMGEAGMG